MTEQDDPLTYLVIGKAMQAHREIGPGLDENLYHKRLAELLTKEAVPFETKPRRKLMHRGEVADLFECDLLVQSNLVVELKVLFGGFPPEAFAQVLCYMKAWTAPTGLLLDFGKESLSQRRINAFFPENPDFDPSAVATTAPQFVSDRELLLLISASADRVLKTHGLGYRDTTYRNLMAADLRAEGIPHRLRPMAAVRCEGKKIGECECDCIVVDHRAAILTVALRDEITAADRAVLQTYLKHLQLSWGVVFNFGKKALDLRFVSPPACGQAESQKLNLCPP